MEMNKSELIDAVAAVSVSEFSIVDYSVFGALLAVSMGIGLYFGCFSKQEQTTEEYLQGGHKMQPLPIAISLVARFGRANNIVLDSRFKSRIELNFSQLSAIAIMATPAEIYSYGWQYAMLFPSLVAITLAANYLFIPVFYHNNLDNCYAVSEFDWTICRSHERLFWNYVFLDFEIK